MFGPYSFINIIGCTEEFDDTGRSRKNMVEVAVVKKIIRNCFRGLCVYNICMYVYEPSVVIYHVSIFLFPA